MLIVYVTIPILRKFAIQIDFVDKPRENVERKLHKEPVPLTAGIAIFFGFVITYLLFNEAPRAEAIAILVGAVLILGIGTVDDWYKTQGKEFPAWPKFLVQIFAAVLIYQSGIVFSGFYNPFTESQVVLPVWLQFVLTVTWIFGVTTVINFSDGMDGLAGGLSVISSMTLFMSRSRWGKAIQQLWRSLWLG